MYGHIGKKGYRPMAHQAGGRRRASRRAPEKSEVQAYLTDYATLLEAVHFPSVVFDHRWDVVLCNSAFETLFRGLSPHPTAMPWDNFLRFVLFHPEAGTVLGEHESRWCLPMLAHFSAAMERHGQDRGLQSILRDIAEDPIMHAAYRHGLPHWIRSVGRDGVEQDGAVRPLTHPDPKWGRTQCRIVGDTPKTLRDMGYTSITLVLREPHAATRTPRRAPSRLRVV